MKKKILIFSDWYLPGYKAGGPIQSVANFMQVFRDTFDCSIITSDTDFSESTPYTGIISEKWTEAPDGTRTFYFSRKKQKRKNLKTLILSLDADFAYFNSMFSLFFTIFPILILLKYKPHIRIILAPRGMLHEGALKLKAPKKKVFLNLFKLMGWHKKILWQATDEQEMKDITRHFGNVSIKFVPNLPSALNTALNFPEKKQGEVNFVFLSRVSEKKNLHFFIECLKDIKGKVILDVWGNKEDTEYLNRCEKLAATLSSDIVVRFKGAYPNHELGEILKPYHFSVLPTLGENFGHSIFESFNNGKPVIISDKTPWLNLDLLGVGWDIPLNKPEQWQKIIQECVEMNQEAFDEKVRKTRDFTESYRKNAGTKEKYLTLFQ